MSSPPQWVQSTDLLPETKGLVDHTTAYANLPLWQYNRDNKPGVAPTDTPEPVTPVSAFPCPDPAAP